MSGNFKIDIIATVGISLFSNHGINVTSLLEQSENVAMSIDELTYSSIRMYETSDDENIKILAELKPCIDGLLADHSINPYYQPQVNYLTGELVGFEALARWKHPQMELVPAYRFIPFAEKSGFIYHLDLKILRDACRDLRAWIDRGLKVVPISINFSRITLLHPSIIKDTKNILDEFAIPKGYLEVEITESGMIEQVQSIKLVVDELRALGFKISLDDFGTGLSNLSALQLLKFDRLKIDRRFVHNIAIDSNTSGIFEYIKGIAELFKVDLLCEGLENPEDLEVLRKNGAGCIQGWILSEAIPGKDIPTILGRFNIDKTTREELTKDLSKLTRLFKL